MEIIEKNYFFKNKDFLEHISQKLKLDDDELYLYLKIAFFILNEKIEELSDKVKKNKYNFNHKFNETIYTILKNLLFYNKLKNTDNTNNTKVNQNVYDGMTEQDIIEIKEMKNIGSMLNIITNLKSYHENINKTNKLVDIILPLCKTEPDYNSDLYDKNICDCDNFEYNDLVSNRQNKKKNIFKVPKLPADRGIIKYLNAIIYSVFLADYENMIVDHNKIFDAIQENLHLENKTIKEENTTLYESYNIDLKELKKKKK